VSPLASASIGGSRESQVSVSSVSSSSSHPNSWCLPLLISPVSSPFTLRPGGGGGGERRRSVPPLDEVVRIFPSK